MWFKTVVTHPCFVFGGLSGWWLASWQTIILWPTFSWNDKCGQITFSVKKKFRTTNDLVQKFLGKITGQMCADNWDSGARNLPLKFGQIMWVAAETLVILSLYRWWMGGGGWLVLPAKSKIADRGPQNGRRGLKQNCPNVLNFWYKKDHLLRCLKKHVLQFRLYDQF